MLVLNYCCAEVLGPGVGPLGQPSAVALCIKVLALSNVRLLTTTLDMIYALTVLLLSALPLRVVAQQAAYGQCGGIGCKSFLLLPS